MTCPACTAAAQGLHPGPRDGCPDCAARAISRGPHFFRAAKDRRLNRDYVAQLEHSGVTHDQVKAAAAIDKAAKP